MLQMKRDYRVATRQRFARIDSNRMIDKDFDRLDGPVISRGELRGYSQNWFSVYAGDNKPINRH